MAGTDSTTSTGSTNAAATAQAAASSSGSSGAAQAVRNNTDALGRVDTQGLVNDVKASSPDVQRQRDFAAQAARQIENRDARREFVQALEDQGVARKPGFFERQWQGVKGLGTGVYEGGASLVTGAYELGKMGVKGVGAAAEVTYNYATDGQYRQQTNAAVGRAADAAVDGVVAAKDYAADRIANPSKLGDDARTVGAAVRSGADAVASKAEQVYDNFDKARSEAVIQGTTNELAGKIVGRTAFEVGSLVVPVTKIGALGKVAEGAELAVDATKVVKGAEVAGDAVKVGRGSEVTADAAKVARSAQASTDAARVGSNVEGVGSGAVTREADRALVRAGDDPARVARVEQEARAASSSTAGSTGASAKTAQETAAAERAPAEAAAAQSKSAEAGGKAVSGETASTATGKDVHRRLADERRASEQFDLVNKPIPDANGKAIEVPKKVDLKTGEPIAAKGTQQAIPDAVKFDQGGIIIDDKPLGRPVAKDRQEIIRFIKAYEEATGELPKTIAIQRYDPLTGVPLKTDLFKPSDFLPGGKP